VAVNLAAAIADRTGRPTALLDAHGALGDIPLLLGIPASTDHDLDDFAIDATTVTRFTTHDPDTGVAVVVPPTGGSGFRRPTAVQLVELLVALEPSTDVVVVDAPLDLVVDGHLAPLAAATVLVTTTRLVHLKNVLVAADLLDRADSIRLVVNEPAEGHRPGDRHSIERAVGLPVTVALPFDEDLDQPDDTGRPRVRPEARSKLARAVEALADELVPPAGNS
jgi:MinD-like ATPase involved in chromosome partitioning or flagellar assembly